MTAKTFTPSARFYWVDTLYEVEQRLPDHHVLVRDVVTGQRQMATRSELTTALYEGKLRFAVGKREGMDAPDTEFPYPTLEDCPAHLADVARARLALLEPLLNIHTTQEQLATHTAAFLDTCGTETRQILGEHITVRTIYRWLKRLREWDGDPRALIPRLHRCGNPQSTRLDKRVEQIMVEAEDAVGKRESITALHDEVHLRIREHNAAHPDEPPLSRPGRATVARRRATRQQSQHEGQAAIQYGQFDMPDYPLERVEIDHTPTDLIVVDDDDHLPLGRLTLSYCVDVKTRLATGYYLGFEPPSCFSVAECLYHAILPKPDWRTLYDTEHTLDGVHGIPFAIATDNGKEFHSQHFSDAMALLGVRHDTMPRLSPEKKPFVERLFGTLNSGLFHIAPGTTLSNVLQRRQQGGAEDACIYLSQIDQALAIFLVDIYAQDSHSGLEGKTPMQAWHEAVEAGFDPRLPTSAEDLYILLGRTTTRVLDRNGFVFEHLRYNSNTPELRRLRHRLDGRGKVKLKYHPGDLSRMYVYDPFERRYIAVPALDQSWTQNLSLWKHRLILQTANRESQRVDREALARARRKIRDIFASGVQRQRYGRWKTNGQPLNQITTSSSVEEPAPLPIDRPLQQDEWEAQLEMNKRRAAEWARQQHLINTENKGKSNAETR